MSDFVYKDYLPANARIIIDYTKHEKVGFSYPLEWTYQKAVWKRGYYTILSFWMSLHIFIFKFIGVLAIIYLIFASIFNANMSMETTSIRLLTYVIGVTIFYLFGIPAIATLILSFNKDIMSKLLPKLGYWSSNLSEGRAETIFNKENISDNKAIIPSFSNVFLEYKATEDFNKYLEKVEILEIPFNYKRRGFWGFKRHEYNDFDFRAVFYFKQTPINGELKVEFI